MLCAGFTTRRAGVIIPIANIEEIAYRIPLQPEHSWLLNDRINIEIWNMLYD